MYAGQVMNAAPAISSAGYAPDQPLRRPEFVTQVDRLEQAIAQAEESLMQLRDRLDSGSLRPSVPATADDAKLASAPPSSGHASLIFSLTSRVSQMGDRICDLLQRLEV